MLNNIIKSGLKSCWFVTLKLNLAGRCLLRETYGLNVHNNLHPGIPL